MRLRDWVEREMAARDLSRAKVLEDLAERSGVSLMTLRPVENGLLMGNYQKAKAVSKATDWEVTIPELCDDDPALVLANIVHDARRNHHG